MGSAGDMRVSASEMIAFVQRYDGHRLSMGMLQYFTERMFISPRPVGARVVQRGRGRPCTVLYDATDLILVRWMVRLRNEGIPLKKFSGALKTLRTLLPKALAEPEQLKFFLLDRNRDVGVSIDGSAIQLTGDVGQVLLAFSIDMARETIAGLNDNARAAS